MSELHRGLHRPHYTRRQAGWSLPPLCPAHSSSIKPCLVKCCERDCGGKETILNRREKCWPTEDSQYCPLSFPSTSDGDSIGCPKAVSICKNEKSLGPWENRRGCSLLEVRLNTGLAVRCLESWQLRRDWRQVEWRNSACRRVVCRQWGREEKGTRRVSARRLPLVPQL